jgi:hypothetical protein
VSVAATVQVTGVPSGCGEAADGVMDKIVTVAHDGVGANPETAKRLKRVNIYLTNQRPSARLIAA